MNTTRVGVVLTILCSVFTLSASSLDGTATPTVIYDHRAFSDGDSIKGFVHFKNGFTVPTAGSITLDIPTEVQGVIQLNGGRLILLEDLKLASSAQIIGDTAAIAGTSGSRSRIYGNGHTIHLSSDFTLNSLIWLNDYLVVGDSRIQTASDNVIYYSPSLTATIAVDSLKFDGHGHRFTFGPSATIFAQSWFLADGLVNNTGLIRLGFRNIQLMDIIAEEGFPLLFTPAGVSFSSAAASLDLENTLFSVKPSRLLILQGIINIFRLVRVDRGNFFLFHADTTIKKSSTLYVGPGCYFIAPNDSPFAFEEAASSKLILDNCQVEIDIPLLGGQVFIDGNVTQVGNSTLILGDGISAANDCDFIILPSARYTLTGSSGIVDKNIGF